MNQLEEKHLDTTRGLHYRYYVSPAAQVDPRKPTFLLCHGWPDSALLWKFVVPKLLKTKLRLIVPDLLGYGGTSKPTDPSAFEIKAMVTDVEDILKAENVVSNIIPVGHDWGAYFASRYYILHKPLMVGFITLNVAFTPPQTEPYDLEATNALMEKLVGYPSFAYWELFADPDGPKLMDGHVDSLWHALHGDAPDWVQKLFCTHGAFREWISKDRKDVSLKPYARDETLKGEWLEQGIPGGLTSPGCWYRATRENIQHETERGLDGDVVTPYLFIGCDGDAVCRTDAIENAKGKGLIKGELEVHELHSNHWCLYEKPDEVAEIITAWLKKQGFSA